MWPPPLVAGVLLVLALAGCSQMTAPPAPEPFTALYVVKSGPYPLSAQLPDRTRPGDGPALHTGCLFDVQTTSPDQHEASYLWAYGRVFRCEDVVPTGVIEPQMGIRPPQLRIYDGSVGYFPMELLDPYTGTPPPARQ